KTTGTQLAHDAKRVISEMIPYFKNPAEAKLWNGLSEFSLAQISQGTTESRLAIREALNLFEEAQRLDPNNYEIKERLLEAYTHYGTYYIYDCQEDAFDRLGQGAKLVQVLLDKDSSNYEWRR